MASSRDVVDRNIDKWQRIVMIRYRTAIILIGCLCAASWWPVFGAQQPEAAETESLSALGNKDPGKMETALGDLAADAIRYLLRTDVAFVAASELRPKDPPIPPGKIKISDIRPLITYPDDPLAVLELTGKELKQALEKSVSIYPQPNLAFLQVSGLKFTFDPKRSSGNRVVGILLNGAPVQEDAVYTVAVTNSMANGALGYWKVWSERHVKSRASDASIVKALEVFFKANPKIDYSELDRIKPIN
ncbi:MAG: 5'-nucleotidase [Armatimonadota bacterium]|nr:5'-nucleotidase [Armatimonadota bacterium]